MTEIEKINSSELGQTIKQIMELLSVKPDPKQIWLEQYLQMTSEEAMTNMWQSSLPADNDLLEVTENLQTRSPETYKKLMQESNEMGEEYWIPQFKTIMKNLKMYLYQNPKADWDEMSLQNAWELTNGPLGEIMQEIL